MSFPPPTQLIEELLKVVWQGHLPVEGLAGYRVEKPQLRCVQR